MKTLNKLKLSSLILIILLGAIDIFYQKNKVEEIKREYLKTDIENIFVQKNKKINLAIINGNKVTEFKDLDNIGEIKSNNNSILLIKNGKYGYIKTNGKQLIPMEYDGIGIFSNGKALAKKNERIGVLDENGEEIIRFEYSEIYIGKNDLFILKKDDKYLSYDLKNQHSLEIDEVFKINEKILVFSKNDKFGIMDYRGDVIIPNKFDEISTFIDKIFIGFKEGKYGLYNLKNEKISKNYDFIEQIGNNEYRGGNNETGKYAFLSEDISTEEKYENISKINDFTYIGELSNETSDMIEVRLKIIKNIKNDDAEKYFNKILEG